MHVSLCTSPYAFTEWLHLRVGPVRPPLPLTPISLCPPADYVRRYATEEALAPIEADAADAASSSGASESSMSDFSEDEARDMEL